MELKPILTANEFIGANEESLRQCFKELGIEAEVNEKNVKNACIALGDDFIEVLYECMHPDANSLNLMQDQVKRGHIKDIITSFEGDTEEGDAEEQPSKKTTSTTQPVPTSNSFFGKIKLSHVIIVMIIITILLAIAWASKRNAVA